VVFGNFARLWVRHGRIFYSDEPEAGAGGAGSFGHFSADCVPADDDGAAGDGSLGAFRGFGGDVGALRCFCHRVVDPALAVFDFARVDGKALFWDVHGERLVGTAAHGVRGPGVSCGALHTGCHAKQCGAGGAGDFANALGEWAGGESLVGGR